MVPTGSTGRQVSTGRDVRTLPKAHLHLHFTGSMRHRTLVELAARDRVPLPDALAEGWPPQLSAADEKGWFRFQRLYDVARSVLRTTDDVRRLVREAAEDDVADGGRWLEIQVDPSGYATRFGGITAFTELVLDAVHRTSADLGIGIGVVIAANRTRHPLDARTLARLAVERGCGRLEWAVLDWNAPSIGFYRALGARPMDEWTVYRLCDEPLSRLAALAPSLEQETPSG